jgi:putative toxin-antitoxin system antitoxin component (TIGR02293 family)
MAKRAHLINAACLDDYALMAAQVTEGFSVQTAFELGAALDISREQLATVIGIPERTLHRRLQHDERLRTDESERVWRVQRLFRKAAEVFESDRRAREWFVSSHPKALGGKTPLEFAATEPGAREVENLLGRIEHGVFS